MSSICQHISVMNDDFIVSFFLYRLGVKLV